MSDYKFFPQLIFRSPIFATNSTLNDEVFSEALYLSTPTFYDEYKKHISKPLTDLKELKKLNISFYKYKTRASNRCTPFGLFAGLSIGSWQTENNITIDADLKKTLNRKTRLDMNVLCSLAQELAKQVFIKPYLKFYPNTSIYLVSNNYRYVEYYYTNNIRFHKINKVNFSDYLENILSACKTGLTKQKISNLLISDDISEEEANHFVDELILAQLLINQFEPTVTGIDYFDALLIHLKEIYASNQNEELAQILLLLTEIDFLIKNIDSTIFNSIDSYKKIHQHLRSILPELSETNLFQTDLYKSTVNNSLNIDIQQQINNATNFLNKISPQNINKNLEEFKKRFYEHYEDYEIPLLIALDTETGVGYPAKDNNGINDLIEDVYSQHTTNETDIKWDLLQAHLLKLVQDSIKHNKKIIEISENDFKNIDFSKASLPASYTVMFKVVNATTNKINISSIGGSSAINLLGRFAGGNDELELVVKQIAEFEQQQMPDKILAEIVHLPESRTGNILARPSFRSFEIPYLAKSSVDIDCQIKMDDLILKIENNKIILFDKRLNKEIIPRLGNAHNYNYNSLPVYHFLCDLQTQYFSKSFLGFNWGVLASQFSFLPRVEYQRSVLSPAKWQLNKLDLEPLQNKKKTDVEKQIFFKELKNRIELPEKFLIVEGDNELLIDCENPIAIDTFIDAVKNKHTITLEEYLFDTESPLIKDTSGNNYTNECIAIVLNEADTKEKSSNKISTKHVSKQIFSIGSEWLYYKIYCGVKTSDFILTEKLNSITEKLLAEGIIDKWFFIRYADPENHLRFRLHISDLNKYSYVLQLINAELEPLLNQHIISKIQTDTYRRELNRYGDNSIKLAEQLFYYDSAFVADMLNLLDADSGGTIRWQIAIRSVDEFLNDFKLTLEEKYTLISMLNTSFFEEHGGKKELKVVLDNKFRTLRTQVENLLDVSNDLEKEYYPIIELLNNRSKDNEEIASKILLLNSNQQLQVKLYDLLGSLLHMNLDRLFMGRNRTNEFVVYDLLSKHYKSTLARLKSKASNQSHLVD